MGLPIKALPTDSIEIEGERVEFRSLSRSEALDVSTKFTDNPNGAEIFILSRGAGISEEEATKWRDETDPITAGLLIDGIIFLTGLASKDDKDPK